MWLQPRSDGVIEQSRAELLHALSDGVERRSACGAVRMLAAAALEHEIGLSGAAEASARRHAPLGAARLSQGKGWGWG